MNWQDSSSYVMDGEELPRHISDCSSTAASFLAVMPMGKAQVSSQQRRSRVLFYRAGTGFGFVGKASVGRFYTSASGLAISNSLLLGQIWQGSERPRSWKNSEALSGTSPTFVPQTISAYQQTGLKWSASTKGTRSHHSPGVNLPDVDRAFVEPPGRALRQSMISPLGRLTNRLVE